MLESTNTGEAGEGKSDEHPIILNGVSSFEMESFMDVIQATLFVDEKKLGWKQKAAALHLATMWSFEDLRSALISFMSKGVDSIDPVDRIEASLKCRVEEWFHPAIRALCERVTPLTASEGERLGFTLFAAICELRETYPPLPTDSCCCRKCGSYHRPHIRLSDLPSSIHSSSVLKFPYTQ
ncbi:hypothetical protein FRC04_011509 [Tulasnella sp. 424]|nr:hypothetical protein FRC04_011509 [Tulasnella sp. 424]KAG8971669.1 hypothetical protein FRC05_010925 [Tulasnella sp. 425]